jgi:hypothetical protein
MATLNNTIVSTVKNKFLTELDKMVTDQERVVSAAKVALREAETKLREITDARDVIRKGLGHMPDARGSFRFVASRTSPNGPGHFIEYWKDRNIATCTCAGYRYNGSCWALDWIISNESRQWKDRSFDYSLGEKNFDNRVKPAMYANYLPSGAAKY